MHKTLAWMHITRSVHPQYMNRIYINDIRFDNVIVPDDHVVQDEKAVYDSMMCTRVGILAGHLERCLRLLEEWTSSRYISTGLMMNDLYVQRTIDKIKMYHSLLTSILEMCCKYDEDETERPR
jgi:alkylation response protein AidB-like acyl-CoA dehydrogenase